MWHYYLNLYQLDRIHLGLVVLAVISQSLLLIPFADLIRSMFDIVIPNFNISELLINTCLLLGLYLIQQLLAFWFEYTITEITLTVSQKLREIILKKREHPVLADRPQTRSLGLYKLNPPARVSESPRRRTSFV
ncbi:MAG: hypothetical protein ACYTX0_39450 [Nostoc sp.]